MLLNNYTVLNSSPGRAIGGFTNLYSNYKSGGWYSFYDPDIEYQTTRANAKASLPTGTEPPYSWILAPEGGELSSTTQINGVGTLTSGLAMGRAISAALTGTGTISAANLSLITSLAATLAGTGSVSASMVGSVSLAASLVGNGSVTAGLSLLANCVATLSGTGSLTANLKGKANLEADIYVNEGSADIQQMAEGVWNAVADDYNTAGTMGAEQNENLTVNKYLGLKD